MSAVRLVAAVALLAVAAVEAAYGAASAPVIALLLGADPSYAPWFGAGRGLAVGAVLGLFPLVIALLTAVSAVGIATGSRPGWWLGLIAAIGWLPTGCAPLSAVALAVLVLVPDVRALAGAETRAVPPPKPG